MPLYPCWQISQTMGGPVGWMLRLPGLHFTHGPEAEHRCPKTSTPSHIKHQFRAVPQLLVSMGFIIALRVCGPLWTFHVSLRPLLTGLNPGYSPTEFRLHFFPVFCPRQSNRQSWNDFPRYLQWPPSIPSASPMLCSF